MRLKQSWWLAAFGLVSFEGCSMGKTDLGTDSPSGGRSATTGGTDAGATTDVTYGGTPSDGESEARCVSPKACGGDVVGSWAVASSCLEVTGTLDLSPVGLMCPSARVTGSLEVSGTWIAHSDGTYADLTITSGEEELTLAPQCLNVSGTTITCDQMGIPLTTLGYSSVTCEAAARGGCTCLAHVDQTAGLGVVFPSVAGDGTYMLSGSVLTTSESPSGTEYRYCVAGDTLTMTPETANPITRGNIVFQKQEGTCSDVTGGDMCPPGSEPPPPAEGDLQGPCDIYAADGGPCVAAHSTVRALYASYSGPLYQVRRSDGSVQDIGVLVTGGLANSTEQDAFCAGSACTISMIYDQSGWGNHLTRAPGGAARALDDEANAIAVSAKFRGRKVYGVHIIPGVGYRNNDARGTATGDDPETEYMVVAGNVFNAGCCFDYGNMERNSRDNGDGAAEAVYFGSNTIWGKGAGSGPWVMADLENGLWPGDSSLNDDNLSLNFDYVTGMVKGGLAGTNQWTIKSADAQSGLLTVAFDGKRPNARYNPMRKEGAIGLGTAGDNSSAAMGNFFEGVMTAHYSSDAADDEVQKSIVSVYGAP